MRNLLLFLFVAVFQISFGQIVTTDPVFPTASKPVVITYNAAEGNQGLMDYTGDIYAHIGVITDKSTSGSDWKYVKTSWGENTPETKLTRIDVNLYTLTLTPSIKDYFGVPDGEKILQIALVFRSFDNSQTGRTESGGDIYADVYEENLSVNIVTPASNLVVQLNDTIKINAAANFSDSLILYLDDARFFATDKAEIDTSIIASSGGKHWIKAEAKDNASSVFDSLYYYIREVTPVADLPSGVKDGINYIDDHTVTLVLCAPHKKFSFLMGDFNDWDYTQPITTQMSKGEMSQVSTTTTWQMNQYLFLDYGGEFGSRKGIQISVPG